MSIPDFAMPKPDLNMALSSRDREELEAVKLRLFISTMKRNWDEVIETYKTNPMARRAQITKLKDTAIHVAVSTGRGDIALKLLDVVYDNEDHDILERVVNIEGNTPLHLAALQGDLKVCTRIVFKSSPQVLNVRNNKGETPLFLAASHGKENTFFFLHAHIPQEELLRREDGNTALHMAISHDYFRMALKIIKYHPGLADSLNEDAESPLHLLANKPNAFRRSTHLGLYDTIIYDCQVVDIGIETEETSPLKKWYGEIFQEEEEDNENKNSSKNHPENYDTCMIFIRTPQYFFSRFGRRLFGDDKKYDNKSDEEEQSGSNDGKVVRGKKFFPSSYDSWVLFLKCLMKALLVVLGFGVSRINKIKKMKEQHKWAKLIMNLLVELSSYAEMSGTHTGSDPTGTLEMTPSQVGISDIAQIKKLFDPTGTSERTPYQVGISHIPQIERLSDPTGTSEMTFYKVGIAQTEKQSPNILPSTPTPILIAAKAGVVEIVDKILDDFPVAIQDVDWEKKNVVLLAVENRQPHVYDLLVQLSKKKVFPKENVFRQVDANGNTALHLAAAQNVKLERPSLIHGSALQMQLEVKWYQFVKKSMPTNFFPLYNNKRETPKDVFLATHKDLIKEASEWLSKMSESCSVVAVLVASVAFATASTVPGGNKPESGAPTFENKPPFIAFAMSSLFALCSSVTALVFFLSIITSQHRYKDFAVNLPRKLLLAFTFLFISIVSMLASFFGGHSFILKDELRDVTYPLYAALCFPLALYAMSLLSLYIDLLKSIYQKIPHKVYN